MRARPEACGVAAAASFQPSPLEACLLTPEEMAKGEMSWLLLHDPWPGSYADPDAGRQAGRLFDGVLVALLVLVRRRVLVAWLPKY